MSKLMLISRSMGLILSLTLVPPISSHAEEIQKDLTETVGWATYKFADRRFKSDFDKTLIFGHAISSNLMHTVFLGIPYTYGKGPGDVLAEKYAHSKPVGNIAEGMGSMETGLFKMYRWVHQIDNDSSESRRIETMNRLYNEAKVIIGIDALYMNVVFNTCEEDGGAMGIRRTLQDFVDKSYYDGKILVLGSVPREDWSKVGYIEQLVLKNNNEACRQIINKALAATCKTEKNCYINNVEGIVKDLNTQGYLTLNDGTRVSGGSGFFSINHVRPRGISLSEKGVQILVEDILKKMGDHPPVPVVTPDNQNPDITRIQQ